MYYVKCPQNGQIHVKNIAAIVAKFSMFDHFGYTGHYIVQYLLYKNIKSQSGNQNCMSDVTLLFLFWYVFC